MAEYASAEAVKKAEILKAVSDAEKEIREKLTEKQIEMLKEVKIVLQKRLTKKATCLKKFIQKK